MKSTAVYVATGLMFGLLPTLAAAQSNNWLQQAATKKIATFDGTNLDKPPDLKKDRRGKVVVRRIRPQAKSDWNTDPTALPYFFYQLRERTQGKYPVYLDNEGIE